MLFGPKKVYQHHNKTEVKRKQGPHKLNDQYGGKKLDQEKQVKSVLVIEESEYAFEQAVDALHTEEEKKKKENKVFEFEISR